MSEMKAFAVVEFPSGEARGKCLVEAVPSVWVSSDKSVCSWPKKNLNLLIKVKDSTPDDTWSTYPIRRIFATYGKGNFQQFNPVKLNIN